MNVWAVANQKGGVGKTTTVVTCAGLLADAGKKVLVIDLDPQGSLTCYFRHEPDQIQLSTYDLFCRQALPKPAEIDRMTLATSSPSIRLLPACAALATVERDCRTNDGIGLRVARLVNALEGQYDHVFIDTPPVLGVLMINALAASQRLLVPVQTDYLAVRGLQRMIGTLTMVNRARGNQLRYSVLPTMFDTHCEISVKSLRAILDEIGDAVEDVVVPRDNVFREAAMHGRVPSAIDTDARGVRAYTMLLENAGVLGRPAPFMMGVA